MGKLVSYVDGSFNPDIGRYAYGCVIIEEEGTITRLSDYGDDPKVAAIRNVAGEMLGAMHSVKWAKEHGYDNIEIYYDYAGIEMWATGGWKAKNEYTKGYAEYMRKMGAYVKITFNKVAAHTGVIYNEEADKLAKAALLK